MSKRAKPVKKRKRTDWKQIAQERIVRICQQRNELSVLRAELRVYGGENDECNAQANRLRGKLQDVLSELTRYRIICDWACQRIEKLEAASSDWEASWLKGARCCYEWMETALERRKEITKLQEERRILLDTLFEVQAENIMQGEDILRQRDELIKLRGVSGERVSCQR